MAWISLACAGWPLWWRESGLIEIENFPFCPSGAYIFRVAAEAVGVLVHGVCRHTQGGSVLRGDSRPRLGAWRERALREQRGRLAARHTGVIGAMLGAV